MINLASPRPDTFEKSLLSLQDELERAALLGIPYGVMPPGVHMGEGESKGLRRIAEAISRIHDRIEEQRVKVLLDF
jgi:deoxyribonuclease-4